MTKYTILGLKLYKNVKKMMDYAPDMKFMNDMPNLGAVTKVFTNPVTALAYDYDIPSQLDSEYQMDKKDIIKALDFWINDRILENEKLLTLHNKLDDYNELELKQLIRIKENVSSMSNDTIFKKFDNDWHNHKYTMLYSETVEFYYEVKKAPDEIENRPKIPTISSTETLTNRTIDLDVLFWGGGRHTDSALNGRRISRVDVRGRRIGTHTVPLEDTSTVTDNMVQDGDGIWLRFGNSDPNNWISRSGSRRGTFMIIDRNGPIIANNFETQELANAEIQRVRDRIRPASRTDGPDHLLHSNLHPGIPANTDIMHATGPTRTVPFPDAEEALRTGNLQPTYMRFENMYVDTINASSDSVSVEVEFRGLNGAEMTVHIIPVSNSNAADVGDGPHTIQLLEDNSSSSRILIDGHEYTLTEPVRVTWR